MVAKKIVHGQQEQSVIRLNLFIVGFLSVDDHGSNSGMKIALSVADWPLRCRESRSVPLRFGGVETLELLEE